MGSGEARADLCPHHIYTFHRQRSGLGVMLGSERQLSRVADGGLQNGLESRGQESLDATLSRPPHWAGKHVGLVTRQGACRAHGTRACQQWPEQL